MPFIIETQDAIAKKTEIKGGPIASGGKQIQQERYIKMTLRVSIQVMIEVLVKCLIFHNMAPRKRSCL